MGGWNTQRRAASVSCVGDRARPELLFPPAAEPTKPPAIVVDQNRSLSSADEGHAGLCSLHRRSHASTRESSPPIISAIFRRT